MEEKRRKFAWANKSVGLIDVAGKSKKLLSPSSAPNSPFDATPSTPTSPSTPIATPSSTTRSLPSFSEDLSLDQTKLPNPMDTANILSWLCWQWVGDLVNKGRKRQLRPTDLYGLSPQDTALFGVERLEKEWEIEKQRNRNSLVLAFFRIWGIPFLLNGLYGLGEDLFLIGQAVILGYLIDALGDNDPGYWYCFGISLAGIASVLVHHQYFFGGERIANQMKAATIGLVYKKAISLSNSAFATTTVGQIINLVTSDCERFLKFGYYFFYIFAAPIELAITLYILWGKLGFSCLLGLALVCVMVPFQMWFGKKFGELRQQTVQLTDSRVRLMNEVISGIRIMKMFGWEPPYAKKIADVRAKEMEKVRSSSFLRGLNISMFLSTGLLLALCIFFTYRFTGHDLTPSKVLVTLAIFAVVQRTISFNVPTAIEAFSEIRVTMNRIQAFLMLEDFQPNDFRAQDLKEKGASVLYRNVCASWTNDYSKDPTLTDISLDAIPGRLVAVVGPVGCGKSSLLLSVVNELRCIPGPSHSEFKREVVGNIAYVSQTPWIISGTVEENITMGSSYDQEKMNHVVEVCALERDLQIMPDGFTTEIGDKGTTLSGGQKARISLARAVYSNKDIYLLDDPLSAVDPAVANHLFHKCIKEALQQKVVILATHQVQFLSHCDDILILSPDGEIEARGKYSDLADRLHKYEGGSISTEKKKVPVKPSSRRPSIIGPPAPTVEEEDPLIKAPIIEQKVRLDFSPTRGIARGQSTVKIVEEEVRKTGSVSAFVYLSFLNAVGYWWFALIFLLVAAAQGLNIITYWWLARWAAQSAAEQVHAFLPALLAALTVTTIVILVTRSILFFHRLLGAAQDVHSQMLNRIMTTPVDFFSANPIGRILNRFSRDIGIMDEIFPGVVVDCVQLAFFCLGVVVFVCVINAFVLVTLVPIFLGFIYIRNRFVKTSREVKRIEATSRSPIQAHFTTSLDGIVSIRAYQLQDDFIKQVLAKQDANTRASFALAALGRWIGFELDGLSIIFLIITVFFAGFSQELLSLKPYLVGLSIVYCIQLLDVFQWCTRQSTEVENQMTSVERCLAYTTLPQEPPYALDTDKDLPPNWPSKGAITLKSVSFSYQSIIEDEIEEKFILNDINAIIESTWKVGIVGRTGAGKTSLMNALFRLINFSGDILIDNISIKSVGLHTLRHKLAVIPQDPILFSGTLRYNLDPFNQSSDLEIWNALERVQLKENIRSHPLGLQHPMSEGGSNFSVGERQLICLARALIRPSSILIMDEATANVDLRTDHIIQTTIREQFRDKTVLVIAHRLHTIIDSDVVMVLDQGRLIEFDSPANLLSEEGVFSDMIKGTGTKMAEELKAKAMQYQIERAKKDLTKDEADQFCTDKTRIKDIKDDVDEVPIIRIHQSTNKGQNSSG